MRKIFATIAFIITVQSLLAQGEVIITESNKNQSFNLSGNLFYLIDTTDELTFSQILQPSFDNKFIQTEKSIFSYKGGSYGQWYKIRIHNSTDEKQELILSIDNPMVADITFFSSTDSLFYHTGANHPFTQKQFLFKNQFFNIGLSPGEQGLYCFKVASQEYPSYLPISLNPKPLVLKKVRNYAFFKGFYISIFLFFVIMLFLLWKFEDNISFVFLGLFLVHWILYNLWREGIIFQYFLPNSPRVNLLFGKSLYPIGVLLLAIFIRFYFVAKRTNNLLRNSFTLYIVISSVFAILQIFIHDYLFFYFGTLTMFLILVIFSVSILYSQNLKNLPFKSSMIAVVVVLMLEYFSRAFFNYSVKGFGFLDVQLSVFFYLVFFGIILYVFLSSISRSKNEILDIKRNLEQMVDKRTFQINAQKEELRAQHEELLLQKETLQSQREELRAQKELLEIKNNELGKLSLVASKTDNLIYIFNPNGELDWFNTSYSLALGLTLEEYKRGEPLNIVDISTNKNIRHVLNTCIREKLVVSYESQIVDENKLVKWYHTTLTPILDEREQIKHLIAIDTDITRLKQYEDELEQQQKDAEHQKNLAIKRKEELEERQVEIFDSIRYAKRIQTAIMPKVKQIQRDFYDSFVLFLPKDIVSGDFYWYHRIQNKYFIAAVDCTGHGVPGAFMSIIGNYLLNSIVIHNQIFDPAEILKQLNRKIKIALKSDNRTVTSDGMDIAMVVVDKQEKTLEFSSALRPMYLFSGEGFVEVKGDKNPITSSISGTTITSFTKHTFEFKEGDMFYIFSDGIIDQFGGESGKKYLTKRFKQLLFEINPLSMREQKDIIKKDFDDWRGDYDQVDDILVIGIRFAEESRF
ncbi:MAG: SpoIIE family protein phosphatase [Salinivirgaceae bacterium]|nr:SpoIIE family protein phosphatase [Salinivirgaceae bacterium]